MGGGGGSAAVEATASVAGQAPLGPDGLWRAYWLGRPRCGSGLRARPGRIGFLFFPEFVLSVKIIPEKSRNYF
jgi:hypothetical protein